MTPAFAISKPLPIDSPLQKLANVPMAPHMGGLDWESQRYMSLLAALVDHSQSRWPVARVVNAEIRLGWKW